MTPRQATLTLGLGIGAILLAVSQARGQASGPGNCRTHDKVVAALAGQFGETRRFIALTDAGRVVELYTAADTGTWSLILTRPSGETCLIGSGEGFEFLPGPSGAGDPA